jgi:septal ring factor EnvC (AmiA/AmiB activator)
MIFIQSINNYSWQAHKPNTVLDKIVSADNCSLTTVGCGAVAQLEINHRTCSTPASEQQVEKLEINLEQKIEQVTAKIENVAETSGKLSEEIYNTVKEADKKIISIEDKVDDLENNMESLAQTVQDNIKGNIVFVFVHRVTICIQIKLRCLYKL